MTEALRLAGGREIFMESPTQGIVLAPKRAPGWRILGATALVGLATLVGVLLRSHLAAPDQVMLYLLVIGCSAAWLGRWPALSAAALSVLAYNFFFVPPFHTLFVAEDRHLLTFAMMFIVGLAISSLTHRIREQQAAALARERQTAVLYGVSRDLGSALDESQVTTIAARDAVSILGGGAVMLVPQASGDLTPVAGCGAVISLGRSELEAAHSARQHGRIAGRGTHYVPGAVATFAPVRIGEETLGVLAHSLADGTALKETEVRLLEALAHQAALAMGRVRASELAKTAALRARTEEMRSSLLSAVSHDLRTPLAAITGAATTLRQPNTNVDVNQRAELLDTIVEEAERLEHLVRNLLDMTRLESGAMEVKREWVPLEEVVGSALARVEPQLVGRSIEISLPSDLPLLSADPVLLELVFVNLLENAAKYTPSGTSVLIGAHVDEGGVVVEVADRGPGLPRGSEAAVFEKFFRAASSITPGVGLGLAICKGIVAAHEGSLEALHRDGGGAVFRIRMPHPGVSPSVPAEIDVERLQ